MMRAGTTRRAAPRDRGFTLTELMVVVAIIGVLAAVSADYMGKEAPVASTARAFAELLGKARRLATSLGPVRSDVTTATGERARTRFVVATDTASGANYVELYRLVEHPTNPSFTWTLEQRYGISKKVLVYGVGDSAASTPGGALPAALGTATKEKKFYSDGTADGMTFYLQPRDNPNGEKWRVWVMPLSGIVTTEPIW